MDDRYIKYKTFITDYIRREHIELRDLGAKSGNEHASIMTEKGIVLGRCEGVAGEVVLSKEIINIIENAPENSLILSHNHPDESSFTEEDLSTLSYYSIKIVSIATPNGVSYIMCSENNIKPSFREIINKGKELNIKVRDEILTPMILNGTILPEQAVERHYDLKCKFMAEFFGWIYERS